MCGTLWPDNLMIRWLDFFSFGVVSIYFPRNLSRLIGNCSKPDFETGGRNDQFVQELDPSKFVWHIDHSLELLSFFVCNKETISNFNMCGFSIFGACFEFVVGVWCGLGDRSYSIFDGFLWCRRWWPGFHTQSKTSSPGSTFQGGLARKFNLLGLSGLGPRLST